jgi:hypothetical protein
MIRARILFICSMTAFLAVPSFAQIKGLKLAKIPADGFSMKVPKSWDQIPPKPEDNEIIAKWGADTSKRGTGDHYSLRVMRFRPRTGTTGSESPVGGGDGEKFDREKMLKRWREASRPTSFIEYWKSSFRGVPLPEPQEIKIGKLKGKLYELNGKGNRFGATSALIATINDGTFDWAAIYYAPTKAVFPDGKENKATKIKTKIKSSLKTMKLFDAVRKSQAKGVDLDNMSEIDKKIEAVKRRLPKSWTVIPTPRKQYVIVHNIPQKKTRQITFANNIVKYLERMRKHYEKVFPARKKVTAVSVVRVCQDRNEYIQYGGPGGSAGYFSPSSGELVIYDASKDGGMADSYSTLFHEAYHQYLFYAVGRVSAHRWFDEGYGDYFAGANPKKGFKIGVFDWRTGVAKKAVSEGKNVHLKDLFYYTQPQYYANPSVCYAQGWALVYFLQSKSIKKKHQRWADILDIYFNTLVKSRNAGKALAAALKDVDIEALNDAYVTFIKRGYK